MESKQRLEPAQVEQADDGEDTEESEGEGFVKAKGVLGENVEATEAPSIITKRGATGKGAKVKGMEALEFMESIQGHDASSSIVKVEQGSLTVQASTGGNLNSIDVEGILLRIKQGVQLRFVTSLVVPFDLVNAAWH